jgi:hypothetical protein
MESSGKRARPLPDTRRARHLDERLRAYALAASAAGVGALALAQPANAQIVYTPANISITDGDLFLDLNCGPRVQFWLADEFERSIYGTVRELAINGSANASVIADKNGAAALPLDSIIGSSRSFKNVHRGELILAEAIRSAYYGSGVSGNWVNVKRAYLGLKFSLQKDVHYGWAELKVLAKLRDLQVHATLTGYAYESVPNQSIKAGQKKETDFAATPDAASPETGTLGPLAPDVPGRHCLDFEPPPGSTPR